MYSNLSRISVTAKIVAYYRQFSDIAFAKEVAEWLDADAAFEQILRHHGLSRESLTFYAPMFEARYKSITQLIREYDAPQVLELASGYSLRGLDLTQSGSIRYAEADLPDVVATKRRLLDDIRRRHGIAASALHTVRPADALDLEQLRTAAAPLDRRQSIMVLCEGLIGYLTKEETARLAANVHRLLTEGAGGWWIVPDFTFKDDSRRLPPERVRLRDVITGITQRQLDASAFENPDELTSFLHDAGFDATVRNQVDETPSFSSPAALGLSTELLEPLRPVLRVWVMTPRAQA